jgi:hypothetical protein
MAQSKVRTIRMKNGETETAPALESGTKRTLKKLLGDLLGTKEDLENLAESLSLEEVQALIDRGAELSEVKKEMALEEKAIKILLRRNAEYCEWKRQEGLTGACSIKASSTTKIDTMALAKKIKELGKQKLFGSLFKADVTAAKQYLGKDEIEEIAKVDREEYGSVSLTLK